MKTASMTAPAYLSGDRSRNGALRYLPYVVIAALLFALLLAASQTQGPTPTINTSLIHLGPH